MNVIVLTGNISQDGELRSTTSGQTVCTFSIAVSRLISKERKEAGAQAVDFFNCTMFGERASTLCGWLKKGTRAAVTGRMQIDNYTDAQGNRRITPKIIVSEVDFLQTKPRNNDQADVAWAPQAPQQPQLQPSADDELPF